MHRFVMNHKGIEIIDHVNGDGLDCRKRNLRLVNRSQNVRNMHSSPNQKKLGFKGVTRDGARWRAQISGNPEIGEPPTVYLGNFGTIVEAAKRYDQEAKLRFGAFAALNFPESDMKPSFYRIAGDLSTPPEPIGTSDLAGVTCGRCLGMARAKGTT